MLESNYSLLSNLLRGKDCIDVIQVEETAVLARFGGREGRRGERMWEVR